MKKILVFGATGHVGAYTIDYLIQHLNLSEFEVIAVGRRKVTYFQKNGIEYCQVDITNKSDFNNLPQENIFAVIHLAGIMPATMKGYDPYPYLDINVRGTLNILEYCRKSHALKIIVTHTEADLSGYWKPGACIDPDLPPSFDHGSDYGMYIISRRTVYEMCQNYHLRYGIIPFFIRCSTIYCYKESPYVYKLGKRIIPGYRQIYDKAIKGEGIEIWGNPKVKTDIVYVKDFAQIVEKAVLCEDLNGGFFNIGTGMPVTLEDQILIAIDILAEGSKSVVTYRPDRCN